MKKVFIACFFVILMLIVPFTTIAETKNINDIKIVSTADSEIPRFFITPIQYNEITVFIDNNIPESHREEAKNIRDNIITPNQYYGYEVDMVKLAEAWDQYGYKSIPKEELNNQDLNLTQLENLLDYYWAFNLFGGLINLITNLIQNRLGWFHRVINDGYYFCVDGVFIAINALLNTVDSLHALANAVNLIITVPQVLYQLLDDLFNKKYDEFLNTLSDFISDFINSTYNLILSTKNLFEVGSDIWNYLTDITDFIWWMITETPWNDKIQVEGIVIKNFIPVSGATITCRGQSTTTNNDGSFSFDVDSTPNENSLPPNVYYGIHDCQITVEENGEILKQSTKSLSYVFSAGSINWPFIIIKPRSKFIDFRTVLLEKLNNLLERLHHIFPIFFRNIYIQYF